LVAWSWPSDTRTANASVASWEASTDFNAYLTLFGPNNFRAFNDDSANAGTTRNSYLVVQALVSAVYLLDFGTRDTARTGNYTISIAGAPPGLTAAATRLGAPARALVAQLVRGARACRLGTIDAA
jgi:hypothetical protein